MTEDSGSSQVIAITTIQHTRVESTNNDNVTTCDVMCSNYRRHDIANTMQNVVSEMSQNEIEILDKEEDLVLAAKLGQTLLEQNEELSSENQRLIKKVEVTHL